MPPDLLAAIFGGRLLMADLQQLRGALARVGHLDDEELNEKHIANRLARSSHKYRVEDGVAHFNLHGPIVSRAEWILDYFGVDYTVSSHFGAAIREAAARDDVRQIVIDADTPGGSVSGLQGAYEAVRDAGKPIIATVSSLCASAGLFIIAAADQIIAEPAAMVGSIGTVVVIRDWSKLYDEVGVKVHVVSTGPRKGMGTPGAPVTDDQLAALQDMVDQLAEQFIAAVAEGRGLSIEQVRTLATGDVWIGAAAQERGLVDRIASIPLAAASTTAKELSRMDKQEMASVLAAHPKHGALIAQMSDATLDEVKAAIAKADEKAEAQAKLDAVASERDQAKAQVTELEAKVTDLKAKLAASEQAKAAAEEKAAQALALGNNGSRDPGGNPTGNPGSKTEDELKAEWKTMTPAQRAPYLNRESLFIRERMKNEEA